MKKLDDHERRIAVLERTILEIERRQIVASPGAVVRAADVARIWPILSKATWKKWIADGTLPSHTVEGTRARFVVVANVEALLFDSRSIEGRQGLSAPRVANDDDDSRHDDRDVENEENDR